MFYRPYVIIGVILGLLIIVGELYGLRMIWITSRKNVVIFTISYLLVSVFDMCIGLGPATFISYLYIVINVGADTDVNLMNENRHVNFSIYASFLVLHTIWCAIPWKIDHYLQTFNSTLALIFCPVFILGMEIHHGLSNLLPYCPALLDILDGAEMTETQLDPTNLVWVQITICLGIIMFYISSLLEIYYLSFPELTTGSILSERRVKFIQLVSSVVFLVLRLALFARNPREFFLVAKTIIRVFCHYQTWSNLRREQQIVSVRATEIPPKASDFAKENLSIQAPLASYNIFVGKADDETDPASDETSSP